jgi:hypothetical protein
VENEKKSEGDGQETISSARYGIIAGLVFGLLMGTLLLLIGISIISVGYWKGIGILLVIAGIAFPIVTTVEGASLRKGKCPHCGGMLNFVGRSGKNFKCHLCKNWISVRNKKFYKIFGEPTKRVTRS